MSWWADFRDGLETAVGLVLNYFYPGTIMLGHFVNSKGSQEQLFGTDWGRALGAISGMAGSYAGNLSNYGTAMDGVSSAVGSGSSGVFDAAGTGGTLGSAGSTVGGAAGTLADPDTVSMAQQMFNNGVNAADIIKEIGVDPTTGMYVGQGGAGQPWGAAGTWGAGTGGYNAGGTTAGTGVSTAGGSLGGGLASAGPSSPTGLSTGASLFNNATGVLGMLGAGQMVQAGQTAQKQADPFGPYRQQYADRMKALTDDPSLIENEPGYRAGMQAVKRSMASQGYTGSGNMMKAMSKYGGDFYNQAMSMYGGLSGAQFNPAQGAALGMQGTQLGLSLAGQSLNRLGHGFGMNQNWNQRQGY